MNMTDERRIRFGRALAGSSIIVAIGGLVVTAAVGRWDFAWEAAAPVNALAGRVWMLGGRLAAPR